MSRPVFWWRKRLAPGPVREAIRLQCAQVWGEYPAVMYLGRPRVSYEVPGRRSNGTVRGRHRVRWLRGAIGRGAATAVGSVLALPVLLPALLVMEILDGLGVVDADAWAFGRPRLTLTGDADGCAVALGDAVRDTTDDLWLAWSGSHLGVVAGQHIAWQVDGTRRHEVRPASGFVDFADGSSVGFVPSAAELDRLRHGDGWP